MPRRELNIEVEPVCFSVWRKTWSKRSARVTLVVDFGDRFVIVVVPRSGLWFLPGGGVEHSESIEEATKREAVEELGLEVNIGQIIDTFNVTLVSRETGEHLKIPPFVVIHTTCAGGHLRREYAPNRKVFLVRKDECDSLLRDFEVSEEYGWMRPYFYVSREAIRDFLRLRLH